MSFTIRPSRRFPVQCAVTNNAGGDTTTRCGPIGFLACGHLLPKRSSLRADHSLGGGTKTPGWSAISELKADAKGQAGHDIRVVSMTMTTTMTMIMFGIEVGEVEDEVSVHGYRVVQPIIQTHP